MNIVITTTWNSVRLIETFLNHYKKLGCDQVLVMDFDSSDGTQDIVRCKPYQDFVQVVPFPGLAGLDSSQLLLESARTLFDPDTHCLFCDPDELLVVPAGTGIAGLAASVAEAVIVPRYNVTARRSAVLSDPMQVTATGSLNLRIDGRCSRDVPADLHKDSLDPPWIYTAIPGKVCVRLGKTISIGDGDHIAATSDGQPQQISSNAYLLHFPMRTFSEFEEKIKMYAVDFSANPQLPEGYGWQARRWIRMAAAGTLYNEYLQQFPMDELVEAQLERKLLTLDNSVRDFHT